MADILLQASIGFGIIASIVGAVYGYVSIKKTFRENTEAKKNEIINGITKKLDSKFDVVDEKFTGICSLIKIGQEGFQKHVEASDLKIKDFVDDIDDLQTRLGEVKEKVSSHETSIIDMKPSLEKLKETVYGMKMIVDTTTKNDNTSR